MTKADLCSEPFHAMGNVVAEGIWNQLGRPQLDRLSLLLRETVQNSWDARLGDSIDFRMESFTLSAAQVEAYAAFFEQRPPAAAYRSISAVAEQIKPLDNWLKQPSPRVLLVSDRRTTGLDGPTLADALVEEDESRNFVDFLRNVGQPPGRRHGGGTFGYGKAALYLASRTGTIVVHTRCRYEGRLESRLIGAALTHNYEHGRRRYTGRHWWGVASRETVAEPFVGEDADAAAAGLGFPRFGRGETGTTIAIVSPAFDDSELKKLGELALRHLWPKLESERGRPPITLSVIVSGHLVQIPIPSRVSPYDAFWKALCTVRKGEGTPMTYSKNVIGRLALEKTVLKPREDSEQNDEAPDHESRPHHVALLRSPELVVKYLDGQRGLGTELVGFAGVFRAASDVDDAFAKSEPPTHDDWQPRSVSDKRHRGIVNKALKDIRKECRDFATPNTPRSRAADGGPLAQLSREFAELLPGLTPAEGSPSESSPSPPNGKRRKRKPQPQAKLLGGNEVMEIDGQAHAVFKVDVTHALGATKTILSADVWLVLGDGTPEVTPPLGAGSLTNIWWESPRGVAKESNPVTVGERQQGTWSLKVRLDESVAVAVEVMAKGVEE